MSVLARDDELLVERNDTTHLSFPTNLFILQNRQKKHNSWKGIWEMKVLLVSRLEVIHSRFRRPRFPSEYSTQDCGMTSTLILFKFLS
jgi:hypothetical protein